MTHKEYLNKFEQVLGEMVGITTRKNSDYASSEDAFANFSLIESLSNGAIQTEQGIVVRMSDKFQRIVNLLNRPAQVKDESIEDTLKDLSVYSIILLLYLRDKGGDN